MQQNLQLIQDLVSQIEDNLSNEINIVKLAKSFDLSPWHFQRLFKSLVGDSLGSYTRGRRLTKAAQLLLNSDRGIIDIAFEVGFNSHEAFSRSFKSHFNVSPKTFRKNKPAVRLNDKPILTEELFHHLAQDINREPMIKTINEHTIIGFDTTIPSPFISNEAYCDLLYSSWMKLLERQNEIPNRIPETYYGLSISQSGHFIEDTVDYIAGMPVTALTHVPDAMVSHSFPEQLVAMFKIATVDTDTVTKTIDYIYGYWLPNSNYNRGNGNDYELFEDVTDFEDPNLSSKYVIPIEAKK
ncbi:MAG: helix-turn-helix domain-containing protein [Gammaproteobacteria bacterium]